MKQALQNISSENPAVAKKLKKFTRKKVGIPNIQTDQPGLLSSIIDIVTMTAAADERRRSALVQSCKSLDDLNSELASIGYCLSRSATYLRLLPRNYVTMMATV